MFPTVEKALPVAKKAAERERERERGGGVGMTASGA
jgi:hypothetical protein